MDRIAASIAQIAAEAGAAPPQPAREWPLDLQVALGRCRKDHPEVEGGAEVIRFILRDWLMGMGYLSHREDPEGAN